MVFRLNFSNEIEHLFMYLFTICIFFLVKCMLTFAHFLFGFVLLLIFNSPLYILGISSSLDT